MSSPDDPSRSPTPLHPSTEQRVRATRLGLSLDAWAVVSAIALAVVVRLGLKVGW